MTCSCKLFERMGYLCRHAFLGFKCAMVDHIPPRYILQRWTKNPVKEAMRDAGVSLMEQCKFIADSERCVSDLWMEFQACVSLAGEDLDKVRCLIGKVREWRELMEVNTFGNDNIDKDKVISTLLGVSQPSDVTIRAPKNIRTKGCGRRIIGEHEKVLEKTKRRPRHCQLCGEISTHNRRTCPLNTATVR